MTKCWETSGELYTRRKRLGKDADAEMKSVANPIWVIESDSCKNSEQNLFQKECFI